jgi:hypothetical protein
MSFWAEQSVWPFVHSVVNIAFYNSFRSLEWAIIALFAWEVFEKITTYVSPVLAEDCFDTLVGDPIIGVVAIFTFWLLDKVTGFDVAFLRHVTFPRRLLVFAAIGIASPIAPLLQTTQFYAGIAIYTAVYVLAILIGFLPTVQNEGINREVARARQSIFVWIGAVLVYALVSVFVLPGNSFFFASSYMRALSVSLALLLIISGGLLALPQGILIRSYSK